MAKGLQGIVWFVAALWIVFLTDTILPLDFNRFGLVPRTLHGLIGIPLMPFLHGNFQHLLGNTVPLCILLFILHGSRRDSLEVIVSIVLLGGMLLWCFGRSNFHIGASGLVYGLVAFGCDRLIFTNLV
jgi:membrane associated rhomboid family serine protease